MAEHPFSNPRVDGYVSGSGFVKNTTYRAIYIKVPASGIDVRRAFFSWPISSIPSGASITKVEFNFDVYNDSSPRISDFRSLENDPQVSSGVEIWDDIDLGNSYLTRTISRGPNQKVDLGSQAVTDLTNAVNANQIWWGFGIKFTNEAIDGTEHRDILWSEESRRRANPVPTLIVHW
ncbi:MAG: hypothetical protein ACE5J2_08465 [Nitrososphaerales archaeon]